MQASDAGGCALWGMPGLMCECEAWQVHMCEPRTPHAP